MKPTGASGRARRTSVRRAILGPRVVALIATLAVAGGAVACAGDGDGVAPADLSPRAAEGADLYQQSGCAGCHGRDADGGAGPSLIGLRDTERELTDGTVVVADQAYLVRAIMEPEAEIVAGYSLRMPSNRLDADEVDAIIAFLDELEPSS